jgi:hypothetical protein
MALTAYGEPFGLSLLDIFKIEAKAWLIYLFREKFIDIYQ